MSNGESKYAPVMSTAAAIAAFMAWMESRKVKAAEPGEDGLIVIPEELMVLIAAIAASSDSILHELQQLVLDPHLTVQGWPDNTKRIRSITIACVLANTSYQPDNLLVPDGMSLIIKSYPLNAVGSLVRVATNQFEATSIAMSYPLLPNEAVTYRVKDANEIWVSSTVAGSIVVFSTEQEV